LCRLKVKNELIGKKEQSQRWRLTISSNQFYSTIKIIYHFVPFSCRLSTDLKKKRAIKKNWKNKIIINVQCQDGIKLIVRSFRVLFGSEFDVMLFLGFFFFSGRLMNLFTPRRPWDNCLANNSWCKKKL
jgi:hypothetical protein